MQIETKEALQNVQAIAAVPGIDVLFIGPVSISPYIYPLCKFYVFSPPLTEQQSQFDLGNNIGHPILSGVMHPDLHAAISDILAATLAAGKKAGIFCTSGAQANKYADMGFHMISVIADMAALPAMMMASLSDAKGEGPPKELNGPYGK